MKKYSANDKKDTRSGYGEAMVELARENNQIIALAADLMGSLKLKEFKAEFPDRFFQTGIAEANMMSIAAGMTIGGRIPFASTFANFATGRSYDQIRQSICYSGKNVKICASHAGLTLGEDGATHQILEDIGMMKMLPGMTVINPCDFNQTKAATKAISKVNGPCYLRFGRPKWPVFLPEDTEFTIGKALTINEGKDVSIFATGHMVWEAIKAGEILQENGIDAEIINIHTIKPIDSKAIIDSVTKTGCAVSAEEHNIHGGLGESISHVLSINEPVPMQFVGTQDTFGESGKPDELLKKYGLTADNIVQAALKVLKKKEAKPV